MTSGQATDSCRHMMSYHENMIFQLVPWKPLDHVPLRNPLVPDVRITAGRSRGFLEPYPYIRHSSLVILLAGKVKKDLAEFLQKQGVKRELKTVKVQIDPGLVKRGNVVDVTDAARRQERIVTTEQEACNLFHGGK